MIKLVYKSLYRSTELGNWQEETSERRERLVTEEQLESMIQNSKEIGVDYSDKYNEFFSLHTDKLHATQINIEEVK